MKRRHSFRNCLSLCIALALFACQASQPTKPDLDQNWPAGQTDSGSDSVVILSYNIHHGQGTDDVFDLPRLAQIILGSNADLVALQEVDVRTQRAGGVDQAAELARLTQMHVSFAKAIDFSGGEYGDAVLSRYPIVATQNLSLAAEPHHETRSAAVVIVALPQSGRQIRFVSTHLDHTSDSADRIAQAKQLLERLYTGPQSDLPTIVVGDMNAQPGSEPMKVFRRKLKSAAPTGTLTYPADQPTIQIDWILMSASHPWVVRDFGVLPETVASDHRPLWARLQLPH
jgi:endonuclease/exonuclease/phosphatase family metal-dependent hydrolase